MQATTSTASSSGASTEVINGMHSGSRKRPLSASNHGDGSGDPGAKKAAIDATGQLANFSALNNVNGKNGYSAKIGGLNGQSGVKRLVIKNLKKKPSLPEDFQAKAIDKLKKAVIAIQTSSAIDVSLEELYQAVETLCSHGKGEDVYDHLKTLIEDHVEKNLKLFIGESLDKLIFMKEMNECWRSHCQQMIMTRSIFLFLDRTYVLQRPKLLSIWELGLETFRRCIMTHPLVQSRTVDGMLMLIEQERHGDVVDHSLLKSLLRMLSDLQIYREAFEKTFLVATEKLYAAEGQRLINERDIPEYLTHVEHRLKDEHDRLLHYLDPSSETSLIQTVEKQLISEHLSSILSKGLDNLLEGNRKDELRLMYMLVGKVVGGHNELKGKMCNYVKNRGRVIVVNPEKDKTMVQELLDFKDKLDLVIVDCFNSNDHFIISMKEAFESFINTRQNKPAELIAKFVDSKLKAGNKEASEEELEKLLDKIMVIFR